MSSKRLIYICLGVVFTAFSMTGCKTPSLMEKTVDRSVPDQFGEQDDTTNVGEQNWKAYFNDDHLVNLIDTALSRNQELNIMLQEIAIAQYEIGARKGEYLPSVDLKAGSGVEKKARYTPEGASEATTDIEPGREMPEPVPDFQFGAIASWEVDIWHELRNAKESAVKEYLATQEGKNFVMTQIIAEIANSYYELLALDNQLQILNQNIEIQSNALKIVKLQKQASRVTELAVRKFEAEVLYTKSLKFKIQQSIVETENKINYLLGRYPQPIERSSQNIIDIVPDNVESGIPSQLLNNRPDIKEAELKLAAAKLDIKVAKANFYPSLDISAGIGLQAFNPSYLVQAPESMLFNGAGDLMAPLINRKAIKAYYYTANAKQIQAVYEYERTVLNAYIEVVNQLSNINNLKQSYELKAEQVQALNESIRIANDLFRSARADYMEVLLTQRDALESKFELVETKKEQMNAKVNIYQALGGGWN